jgi:hypothetical protein
MVHLDQAACSSQGAKALSCTFARLVRRTFLNIKWAVVTTRRNQNDCSLMGAGGGDSGGASRAKDFCALT